MYPVQQALVIGEFPDFSEIPALHKLSTFRSPTKFPQSFSRPQSSTYHDGCRSVVTGDYVSFDRIQSRSRAVPSERIPDEWIHNVRQSGTQFQSFRRAKSETQNLRWIWTRLASRQYPIASTMLSLILQVTHFLRPASSAREGFVTSSPELFGHWAAALT